MRQSQQIYLNITKIQLILTISSIVTFGFGFSPILSLHGNSLLKYINVDPSTLPTLPSQHSSSSSSLFAYPPRKNSNKKNKNENKDNQEEEDAYDPLFDEPEGRRGDARNWIEKSSPLGIGKLKDDSASSNNNNKAQETDGNYDLGIDGVSFQTGPLSTRMYDALLTVALKRFPPGTKELPIGLDSVYKSYAMDITAKEAVKAAFDQNGMQLALLNDESSNDDEMLWGDVEEIKLYDEVTNQIISDETYDSLDDAVERGQWRPGQPFSFIVRNVPSKLKEMDISDVLAALDPEGKYRAEAKEKSIAMPDEDIATLKELGKDCDRRTNLAPTETLSKNQVYKGNSLSKGYNIIKRSDLLPDSRNKDGTENNEVLMHVMNSLVSHGCLIVDLSDGGMSSLDSSLISKMWDVVNEFFDKIENDVKLFETLPDLKVADGAGSPNAVCGFKSYNHGSMQFLETRIRRDSEDIVPSEAAAILGDEGVTTLIESFNLMCNVGKDIVRVSVAASNMEHDGFLNENMDEEDKESSDLPFLSGLTFEEAEVSGINEGNDEMMFIEAERLSSEAALRLADDLIDDAQYESTMIDNQGSVSMSPHRLCKYMEKGSTDSKKPVVKSKETFGAHTDTSFVTIVPVAAVSGLEIFDEEANKWFRPELLAREKWEKERVERGLDPTSMTENIGGINDENLIAWHSRYICVMPGELLQVCTRNEVPAAVHRVVCESGESGRLSAPVLLRTRSGMIMDAKKYFGNNLGPLLEECDGMKMEEIHDKLQPSSYRS